MTAAGLGATGAGGNLLTDGGSAPELQRSESNAARISLLKSSGSSHAAK